MLRNGERCSGATASRVISGWREGRVCSTNGPMRVQRRARVLMKPSPSLLFAPQHLVRGAASLFTVHAFVIVMNEAVRERVREDVSMRIWW